METQTIESPTQKSSTVTEYLNEYLANYQIHYQKLRGCHWNITGTNFFPLHDKFEELYTHAQITIDELAERIIILEAAPLSTFLEFLEHSTIKEIATVGVQDIDMIKSILGDFKFLISLERKILQLTADTGDDGTNDMVNSFMQYKEKNSWMLRAFCEKK